MSQLLRTRFAGGERVPALLVYRRAGGLTSADRAAIRRNAARAAAVPLVGRPGAPIVSGKGDVAIVVLPLAHGSTAETKQAIESLRSLGGGAPGLEAHLTGTPALLNDISDAIKGADATLLAVTGLLVLVLLVLIYRSPLLALIPLVVVGVAYAVATGIVDLVARAGVSISGTSTSLLLVLMFGVGTDYCLLLVGRYSGLLRARRNADEALADGLTKVAPAIAASGITVMLALLALLASTLSLNRTLGPVNAIGIGVVLLASLTLLPALLAIAGRRAFWPKAGRVAFVPGAADEEPSAREALWARFARRVLAHPAVALAGSVLLLCVCACGLLAYRVDADVLRQFRSSTDGTRGYDVVRSEFPRGTLAPTTAIVVRDGARVAPADIQAVRARLLSVAGVAAATVARVSTDGRAVALSLVFADDPYGSPALARVGELRSLVSDVAPGVRVVFGDGTASRLDFKDAAGRDFKVMAPLVLVVVLLTLMVLLRALVAPLYLVATVVLSFLAALGVSLVLFRLLLGERSFDPELPIFAFIFLVALGSDYTIFLMSRVREEARTVSTRDAALRGVAATGPTITSAGLVLAGTFAVLAVLPITILVEIGIAVAVGVLIDTFLVRTLTVPALASLVGDASWWPNRARRG